MIIEVRLESIFWLQLGLVFLLASLLACLVFDAMQGWRMNRRFRRFRDTPAASPVVEPWEPKFCPDCGTPIERVDPAQSNGRRYRCPVCRHQEEGGRS